DKFFELLYAGEFLTKIITAAFVAAVDDDADGHRYRLLYGLVRADGIGDWTAKLDEVLAGPASQYLSQALHGDRRVFTERVDETGWQHAAVQELHEVLTYLQPTTQQMTGRVNLRAWFAKFVEVRNKTRGHGATTPAACAR